LEISDELDTERKACPGPGIHLSRDLAMVTAGFDAPRMKVVICATIKTSVCYRIAMQENSMKRASQSASSKIGKSTRISGPGKLREVMLIAEEQGLLRGERDQVVRGRMPKALVAQAKKRTGVVSDTDLIELALANIAVADDYAEWLLARRGAIDQEADLEF
jgi:hypothetical protein